MSKQVKRWWVPPTENECWTALQSGLSARGVFVVSAGDYDAAVARAEKAERERDELRGQPCRDCCCARIWRALGIGRNTGHNAYEHVEMLRDRATRAEATIVAVRRIRMQAARYIALDGVTGMADAIDKALDGSGGDIRAESATRTDADTSATTLTAPSTSTPASAGGGESNDPT
jgi:hypothetical protein